MVHHKVVGARAQVYKGHAKHTKGGLTKSGITKISVGKGKNKHNRYVSTKKRSLAKRNSALTAWVKAAKSEGYLQKGNFKPLPKKGTAAYNRIAQKAHLSGKRSSRRRKSSSRQRR